MKLLDENIVLLGYLLAAVCFILALKGLSSPRTARRANGIGVIGAVIALASYTLGTEIRNGWWIALAIVVGTAIAVPAARRVHMTQMPQLVAAFNGVGGGAAALVALVEFTHATDAWSGVVIAFTVFIGGVSLTGSFVTFGKLQGIITGRAVVFPGLGILLGVAAAAVIALATTMVATGELGWAFGLLALGLVIGVFFVLPIGGADVPIVISLLNAFTGLAVAGSGLVLSNVLLLVAGTLVGASGTILTTAMATAMGRSVTGILFGAFRRTASGAGPGGVEQRPVRTVTADDVAILLEYSNRIVIVPGYGLAVAQAHHAAAELAELLTARGADVVFGIHPVAGRMPGHMNVLLAEANVPYESLLEMDVVNGRFSATDLVLVIGANDVVNPAAMSSPGSPIYGMPILHVADAAQVVFLKRSLNPGFAGIENELFFDPKVSLALGDAKETLSQLLAALKAMA